jgi:hypothetical protein
VKSRMFLAWGTGLIEGTIDGNGSFVVGRGRCLRYLKGWTRPFTWNAVDESPTLGTMDLDRGAGNRNKGFRVVRVGTSCGM